MKIKSKLLAALSVATVMPIAVIGGITSYLNSTQTIENFENSSSQTLSAIEKNFSGFVGNIKKTVNFLATSDLLTSQATPLTHYDETVGKAPALIAEQNGGYERDVYRMFKDLGKNYPELVYVYAGDEQGGYIEWPGTYEYAQWEPKKESWYVSGIKSIDKVVLPGAYYWEPDDAVYVNAVRAMVRDGKVDGVVAVDVSIKTLTDMAASTVIGETGNLMVIEDSGTILVDVITPDNSFKNIHDLTDSSYEKLAETNAGVLDVSFAGESYKANILTSPSLGWKFIALVPTKEIYASTIYLIETTVLVCLGLLAIFIAISFVMARRLIKPIEMVSNSLQVIAEGEGDLTAKIKIDNKDETGILANWFNLFLESTRSLIQDIKQKNSEITSVAEQTAEKAHQVAASTTEQQHSIDQIVSAGHQMVQASSEAAQNCAESAQFSERALDTTQSGKKLIKESSDGVNRLGERLHQSNKVIIELENETSNINQILSTIQDIAEQTNLLALNAAIEAARAGEQGRGFAVVADEVRGLAQRTQESTEQINKILGLLMDRTKNASKSMVECLGESERAIELSGQALDSFQNIEEMVKQMNDMTLRTAASAEEQRAVTEDINSNISLISASSQLISQISDEVASLCERQDDLSKQVQGTVSRFRT